MLAERINLTRFLPKTQVDQNDLPFENLRERMGFYGRVSVARYRTSAHVDWLSTGIPAENAILNLVMQRRTDGADVHDRFHRVFSAAYVPGAPLFWVDGPATTPPRLANLYAQHGLQPVANLYPMALEVRNHTYTDYPDGLTVTPVRVRPDVETFVRIVANEHPVSDQALQRWVGLETRLGAGMCGCWERYIGSLDGTPVATAAVYYGQRTAGIYHIATLPAARGHGIGTAMTRIAMEQATRRGYRQVTLISTPQGYNLYQRLGFQTLGQVTGYMFPGDDEA